jgi:hypothetical protein
VEVTYDVDVSRDSTLALRLSVNDRPISVWSPTSGTDSLCHARSNYTRGSMSFRCVTKNLVLHNGDSLSAQFVRDPPTATALPPGKIVPAKDTVKRSVPATDTSLYVVGSLAQTNGSQAATVQASVRNVPLPWLRTVGDRYSGSLSPYLDALWTTDPTTKGYVNLGAQYNGYLSELGPVLQQIAFFITPRTESDKKLTVMNFMYLDAEVRPGIYGLYTGRLPLGGHYRVWPHAGVELGHTIKGTAVVRPESNDPSRWKAGVNVIAGWPASKSKSFFCTVFGCAGFDINADYQHYWLNDVPVAAPTARDVGTIKATYKFTDHVGLALAYQNGNPPPLFAYQRVIQIGISFMR